MCTANDASQHRPLPVIDHLRIGRVEAPHVSSMKSTRNDISAKGNQSILGRSVLRGVQGLVDEKLLLRFPQSVLNGNF